MKCTAESDADRATNSTTDSDGDHTADPDANSTADHTTDSDSDGDHSFKLLIISLPVYLPCN